jgi:hypothetical protein
MSTLLDKQVVTTAPVVQHSPANINTTATTTSTYMVILQKNLTEENDGLDLFLKNIQEIASCHDPEGERQYTYNPLLRSVTVVLSWECMQAVSIYLV